MSAQGRGYTYSFRQILAIIGNGDNTRGRKLLDELAERMEHARTEHPESEWAGKGDDYALEAIEDEVREVRVAMKLETPHRVKSELKDAIATCVRAWNDEHK